MPQSLQAELPVDFVAEKVPAGQGKHVYPSVLKSPAAQGSHVAPPVPGLQ